MNVYVVEDKKDPNPLYVAHLHYDLANSTYKDYILSPPSDSMTPMELQSGSLVAAPGLKWVVETGTTPYELPADFFEPKTILIPPQQPIRVDFYFEISYTPEIIQGKSPLEVAIYSLRETESFILLDRINRYRIELPLAGFKSSKK